jgi:NAD+ synthase (glutamine-hydrolysing)
MKIAAAQLNPTVGDMTGNVSKLRRTWSEVSGEADLVVFPEMFVTGYPPKDLLEYGWFIRRVEDAIERVKGISKESPETGMLIGTPVRSENGRVHNGVLLIQNGEILAARYKSLLPTYDVFDETRYFEPSTNVEPVDFKGERIGVTVCEDAWNDPALWPEYKLYHLDPVAQLAGRGATLLINVSASPFAIGKEEQRFRLIAGHARKHKLPFLYVNQVGGNDELIFDGRSLLVDAEGRPVRVMGSFREQVQILDSSVPGEGVYRAQERIETVHEALVLGLGDYMAKCGFTRVIMGLSGGIDSSVTAVLAKEALGSENVMGLIMPTRYSSESSVEDAVSLADNLGIQKQTVRIDDIYQKYIDTLQPLFQGRPFDSTEENIQARVRGNVLMAFSNKFGHLVLSTGNKSELAMGYCTLYGDMSGGLAVISDLPKTMVYELAEYINREGEVIPDNVLRKPPSAELRPGQTDQDALPPYEVLDSILAAFVEEGLSWEEIVDRGYDPMMVKEVIRTVISSEYKRKQAAPGLKITTKAFGIGRRMPIAARYGL